MIRLLQSETIVYPRKHGFKVVFAEKAHKSGAFFSRKPDLISVPSSKIISEKHEEIYHLREKRPDTSDPDVLYSLKSEADVYRVVHLSHDAVVEVSHLFTETALVDRTYLFEQDHGVLREPESVGYHVYVRWQAGLPDLTRDCRRNDGRAVFVPDVVLDDQHRSESALLRADDRTEIRIINIAAFDGHFNDHSFRNYQVRKFVIRLSSVQYFAQSR